MIKIQELDISNDWKTKAKQALEKYKDNLKNNPDFNNQIWGTIKEDLAINQSNKCCYCEIKRQPKLETDVEHFRPKKSPTENKNHPGYWWLAYEIKNYFFACKTCNEIYKKNHFPLKNEPDRLLSCDDYIDDPESYMKLINTIEKPLFIHPIEEDPEEFFIYDWRVKGRIKIFPSDKDQERAQSTIEKIGLNNTFLKEERFKYLNHLRLLDKKMKAALYYAEVDGKYIQVNQIAEDIKKITSAQEEFAGFKRDFFKQAGLAEYINND